MDRQIATRPDARPIAGFNDSPIWFLVLLALIAWQAWMTLSLFAVASASDSPFSQERILKCWQRLLDDQPIVSGHHPLHLYMGCLGAQAFIERGTLCAFDPSQYVGYLKSPVFDSGSRPAELFLIVGGGEYRPAAYKIGLAVCCCLVPFFLALAGWGLGLGRGFTCLAVAVGLLIFWGGPGRAALEDGNLDLLLASLAAVTYIGVLVHFDRAPGFCNWLVLLLSGTIGWFAHPVVFLLLMPLALLYYVSVGVKHQLNWHLALFATLFGALAANSFWLPDWVKYWWIRLPLQLGAEPLRHRTLHTIWSAPLWGDDVDRTLAAALFVLALLGVIILNQSHVPLLAPSASAGSSDSSLALRATQAVRGRPAARMLGLGVIAFLALAIGGIAMQPLGRLGAAELLLPALWFAVLPAVFCLGQLAHGVNRLSRRAWTAPLLATLLIAAAVHLEPTFFSTWMNRCRQSTPLAIGLGPQRDELVELLRTNTGGEGRILWEDRTSKRDAPCWSALLPLLTERSYLGGLDAHASIEHAYASFIDQHLAGRNIADWTDAELDDFCRRYNVGWVVCWSPAAINRLRAYQPGSPAPQSGSPGAAMPVPIAVHDDTPGYLFTLPPRSYVLKGQARWIGASRQRIALADVIPEDGKVVLSLHYQAGLQVSPGRVQIEREPDPFDPIPFIRLRVPGPVARLTLTWTDR